MSPDMLPSLYVVTELYICYYIDQFIMFESYEN